MAVDVLKKCCEKCGNGLIFPEESPKRYAERIEKSAEFVVVS
jgi:hypothetical protein